eukprot:CAMPEP_0178712222 /NCGR_PEP_ID=MMETSP0699-20121125/18769_1 /TAXON_ID=265572 /ORGANISM="Extubocellulus spinifer, Strain CCMP396" /LENGTH=238 /DNA_ID=CAMNT_0020360963 /DNA_START=499 /DNA_END=1212 /DNA_ORIENTATION=+
MMVDSTNILLLDCITRSVYLPLMHKSLSSWRTFLGKKKKIKSEATDILDMDNGDSSYDRSSRSSGTEDESVPSFNDTNGNGDGNVATDGVELPNYYCDDQSYDSSRYSDSTASTTSSGSLRIICVDGREAYQYESLSLLPLQNNTVDSKTREGKSHWRREMKNDGFLLAADESGAYASQAAVDNALKYFDEVRSSAQNVLEDPYRTAVCPLETTTTTSLRTSVVTQVSARREEKELDV